MMGQIVVFHYEPDGSDVYLPLGFVPDYVEILEVGATAPLVHRWYEMQEDDEASGSQEGVIDDGDGTLSLAADSQGIIAYDSGTDGPTVTVWSAGLTVVARSASVHGTYIKPTVAQAAAQGVDREAIFEVVTNTTTGTTEPTWPAGIGEQVSDNHGSPVVYERVNVPLERVGYQGIVVANELQTDGQEMYGFAVQADKSIDFGDVVGWTGGVYGA
jgi:hypothetical protein